MAEAEQTPVRVPPRWFMKGAWTVHRGLYRATPGTIGLRRPQRNRWGMLRLTTIGRRSGEPRSRILAYLEDGADLSIMAMNGWGEGDPAWWLNLQARPDAAVDLVDGHRLVRGHEALGDERERLWARWKEVEAKLDDYAAVRSTTTAMVLLTARP